MSLHQGQEKKFLRGQIIISKVTLERAPGLLGEVVEWGLLSAQIYTTLLPNTCLDRPSLKSWIRQ